MELLQLKYFKEVAECENASHIAHKFMVAPSSISTSIKKLENELEVKLFDRTANTIKLNECGKILLRAVKNAEKEIHKAKMQMLELSQSVSGEIHLLILTNREYVMTKISSFKSEYPKVSFNIKHVCYNDNGNYADYDIIVSDRNITAKNFKKDFFIHEEVCFAVSAGHKLFGREHTEIKDFENEKIICMPKGSSMGDYVYNLFKDNNIHPIIAIECDEPQYIREYMKIGLGGTFFPIVSWQSRIDKSVKLLKIENGLYRDSYIYTNENSKTAVKLFREHLR